MRWAIRRVRRTPFQETSGGHISAIARSAGYGLRILLYRIYASLWYNGNGICVLYAYLALDTNIHRIRRYNGKGSRDTRRSDRAFLL